MSNYPYKEPINPNPKLERQIDRARSIGVDESLIVEIVSIHWNTESYPSGPHQRRISGTLDIKMIDDLEALINDRRYEID